MEKNRIEAFSDAVLAVAITLLVLEIKVPEVSLAHGEDALIRVLLDNAPKLAAYFTSFIIVAVWWVAHHQLFYTLHKTNRTLLWINMLFLMWVCLIPFPTALIGDYPTSHTAAFLYGAVATLTASSFSLMRWYVSCKAKLLKTDLPEKAVRQTIRKSLLSPSLHFVGMFIAVPAPAIALAIYAAIAILFIFPSTLDRHIAEHANRA
jgi:uncharacterized membrane protein